MAALVRLLVCALASLAAASIAIAAPRPSIAPPAATASKTLMAAEFYRVLQFADSVSRAHDDAHAAEAYQRLAAADSSNGRVWQALAWSWYRVGRFEQAAPAFRRVMDMGGGKGGQAAVAANAYNVACCEARLGHRDEALSWLERSLALGFEGRGDMAGDEDLTSLRGDPRFEALVRPSLPATTSRDAGWRGDLDFLTSEVRRLHAVYRSEPLPASFDRAAEALRADIPRVSDAEIAMRIQGLLALLQDGHSVLWPGESRVTLHPLPLRFYVFPEGLYVVGAPNAHASLVGRRVTSIGGRPVPELLAGLRALVSRDNDMGVLWVAPRYLGFCEVLQWLGCAADSNGVDLTVDEGRGAPETVRVNASSDPIQPHIDKLGPPPGRTDAPLWLRNVGDAYWTEKLEDGHALYVQFSQVANKPDETLGAFGLRLRRELATGNVSDLIVDVRHNNGGNGNLLGELVRTLVAFDASHPGRHLFVITGRGTFSAAQVFINRVEAMTNAVFVGEPSSSKPDFVGEDTPVRLPFSGLVTSISSRRHFTEGTDTRCWISPSVPAPLTAADYFAGRDRALDAVIEIIRGR